MLISYILVESNNYFKVNLLMKIILKLLSRSKRIIYNGNFIKKLIKNFKL